MLLQGNEIQIADKSIKIKDLGLAMSDHPEWFPEKFEIRLNEEFLISMPIEFGVQFTAFIVDLEIMSMMNFDMKHWQDPENLQYVYEFTRKVTKCRKTVQHLAV